MPSGAKFNSRGCGELGVVGGKQVLHSKCSAGQCFAARTVFTMDTGEWGSLSHLLWCYTGKCREVSTCVKISKLGMQI